jgi:hypothetical protein
MGGGTKGRRASDTKRPWRVVPQARASREYRERGQNRWPEPPEPDILRAEVDRLRVLSEVGGDADIHVPAPC